MRSRVDCALLLLLLRPAAGLTAGAAGSRGRAAAVRMATPPPTVLLTREAGKNGKLSALLQARSVPCAELPCIAAERLPGCDELQAALAGPAYGWTVITSPEAAAVFADAWRAAGSPAGLRIASVGAGTAQVLAEAGAPAEFVPSKATGKALAAELPPPENADADAEAAAVLYPASALAANVVQSGLAARGISTKRIDTYTTVAAAWSDAELETARAADVVTFASPSAVRVWAERVGVDACAVCIGETSAAECRKLGFERVHAPGSPGVAAWADAVAGLGLWPAEAAE